MLCKDPAEEGAGRGDAAVRLRHMDRGDGEVWLRMRGALWPEEPMHVHARMIEDVLDDERAWGFIAETSAGTPIGFAEVSIRKAANGCTSQPVPFLEGIWVHDGRRRQRIGTRFIRYIAAFLANLGYHELGSDTLIDNIGSQHAHIGWGFVETERVVYYRKELATPPRVP